MSSKRKPVKSTLSDLKRFKESKASRLENFSVDYQGDIFESVNEKEYQDVVRRRMLEDDFVVDDDGYGYADTGVEEWNNDDPASDEEPAKRKGKVYTTEAKNKITDMFKAMKKKETQSSVKLGEDDANLLDSLISQKKKSAAPTKLVKQPKPQKTAPSVPMSLFSEPILEPIKRLKIDDELDLALSSASNTILDDDYDFDQIPTEDPLPASEDINQDINLDDYQLNEVIDPIPSDFLPKFNVENEVESELPPTEPMEQDDFRMFWIDAYDKGDGTVFLFGKTRMDRKYVSCCLKIDNIQRNVFFLPKQGYSFAQVHQELQELFKKFGIKKFACKKVVRRYAFEVEGVPEQAEYLKVVYPFTAPQISKDVKGESFSHVFGTNTSGLEQFIVKRKLMGPCWIKVADSKPSEKPVSWCKIERIVENPKNCEIIEGDLTVPSLVGMCINTKTVMSQDKRSNEIAVVTCMVYDISLSNANETRLNSCQTVIRQLGKVPFPYNFQNELKAKNLKVEVCQNERALLNYLMALIHRIDPDVLIGHNILGFDLDVLLHRLKSHNVNFWSRIGRLRRSTMPKLQSGPGGMGESTFEEKSILSGRLGCDTYLAAKDLMRAKSYSLANLSKVLLNTKRMELDFEKIPLFYKETKSLLYLISHSQNDAYLASQLMFKLNVLSLTKQLTNLAGNLWVRTLLGARAERNEFLLLHEFHKNKFICPDKSFSKKEKEVIYDSDNEGMPTKASGRRKPAYSGGLVLEPKKGFYDKYVLLLDFNSLYPSIIQEYNICFTTISQKSVSEDQLPEVPDKSLPQGILPKLLANLVARRRQVKDLMKDKKITEQERTLLDIRQKALKLTANSMYGCLGFTHSRFFAKPLAMLITHKGREILQDTVNLATEKCHLEVIYGDTDSIMIHTGMDDIQAAKEVGKIVKQTVNEKYKLLEIELDGIFQKLLLLKKKKYAAAVIEERPDGIITTKMETKGLDLVRRDWCGLSVEASNYVLDRLFSGKNREEIVESIHVYLNQLAQQIKNGEILLEKYIINKGLTKSPEEYADARNQPHVQVALRMKTRGVSVKAGDTIPYVLCVNDQSQTMAEKAKHPDEMKKDSELVIDFDWYLKQQIHPPISRLCQHIEGTDSARIADCLGLDASKYHHVYQNQEESFAIPVNTVDRFKNVQKWLINCPSCHKQHEFKGLIHQNVSGVHSGTYCPSCANEYSAKFLYAQLHLEIRKHLKQLCINEYCCEDPSCGYNTKFVSVVGSVCPVVGCNGTLKARFSEFKMYQQLVYYSHLLDREKLSVKFGDKVDQIPTEYEIVSNASRGFLKDCATNVVDLKTLFNFMSVC